MLYSSFNKSSKERHRFALAIRKEKLACIDVLVGGGTGTTG